MTAEIKYPLTQQENILSHNWISRVWAYCMILHKEAFLCIQSLSKLHADLAFVLLHKSWLWRCLKKHASLIACDPPAFISLSSKLFSSLVNRGLFPDGKWYKIFLFGTVIFRTREVIRFSTFQPQLFGDFSRLESKEHD